MTLRDPRSEVEDGSSPTGELWPQDLTSLLNEVIRSSDDAIITKNLNGIITSWNPAAVCLFGYLPEEVVGKSILIIIPPEMRDDELEILRKLKAGERIEHYETTRRTKGGEDRLVSVTISPLKNARGDIVGASKIIRDITRRKQADESLFRLAAIVGSSEDAILSKDLSGHITSWNASATRMFGYSESEMIGSSILRLIPEELQGEEQEIIEKIRAGQRIENYETIRLRKDGGRVEVSLTISPIKDRSGEVLGASKVLRDISERKRMEQELSLADKIAATGRMAAIIAHEINNPLEAVLNLIYLARTNVSEPEQVVAFLKTAESEMVRIASIARSTLGYYREHSLAVSVSLPQVIQDALDVYGPKLRESGIEIQTSYSPVPEIVLKKGEITQVISNILSNARHAMSSGGTLAICLREAVLLGRCGLELTIDDQGIGIPKVHLDKVFEPFFTTRDLIGSGMGLWIVKRIIEDHAGVIQIDSSMDPRCHGTRVSIFLPFDSPFSSYQMAS